MKLSRKKWTRSEKWLLLTPALVGIFAIVATLGPSLVRRKLGYPDFVIKTVPGVKLTSIALSRDGKSLAATGFGATIPQNGDIWIWNAHTLALSAHWPGGPRNPNGGWASRLASQMQWSKDGKTLMFGRMSEPFLSCEVATRRVLWKWGHASFYDSTQLSPDGRLLFVPDELKGMKSAYALLNSATGKPVCRWSGRGFPSDPVVTFSPDGKTLACIGPRRNAPINEGQFVDGRNIEIRRVSDGRLIKTIPSPWTRRLEFSPDGTRLVAFGEPERNPGLGIKGSSVRCFMLGQIKPLWTYDRVRGDILEQATWASDGQTIAVAASPDRILLLDANTGATRKTLRDSNSRQSTGTGPRLIFSPDGKRLFGRGEDAVLVWNLE